MKKILAYFQSSAKQIIHKSPRFPYPYDFTHNPQKFQLQDSRFYEEPIITKLYPKQISHVQYVLKNFNSLLNKGKIEQEPKKYVHSLLLSKTKKFQEMLKQYSIKAKFSFHLEPIQQAEGFLQYYGLETETLEENLQFIQDYNITRNNEIVKLEKKEKKTSKKNLQEQLAQDIKSISNKQGAQVINKLKETVAGKPSKKLQQLINIAQAINALKPKTKTNNFEKYIYVDRIQTRMMTTYWTDSRRESKLESQSIMTTKWLYIVNDYEPEQIKQSKKRILFDFQLWNRGFFMPNKQYV